MSIAILKKIYVHLNMININLHQIVNLLSGKQSFWNFFTTVSHLDWLPSEVCQSGQIFISPKYFNRKMKNYIWILLSIYFVLNLKASQFLSIFPDMIPLNFHNFTIWLLTFTFLFITSLILTSFPLSHQLSFFIFLSRSLFLSAHIMPQGLSCRIVELFAPEDIND